MANLLTSNDITSATGILSSHFDTFANRSIIVHKEPLKQYNVDLNSSNYFGYANQESNFSLITVSGIYPALIRENDKAQTKQLVSLNTRQLKGEVTIKVKQEARDFIKNGKTESIQVDDGRVFNIIADESIQNYLGLKFYYFGLERTA